MKHQAHSCGRTVHPVTADRGQFGDQRSKQMGRGARGACKLSWGCTSPLQFSRRSSAGAAVNSLFLFVKIMDNSVFFCKPFIHHSWTARTGNSGDTQGNFFKPTIKLYTSPFRMKKYFGLNLIISNLLRRLQLAHMNCPSHQIYQIWADFAFYFPRKETEF